MGVVVKIRLCVAVCPGQDTGTVSCLPPDTVTLSTEASCLTDTSTGSCGRDCPRHGVLVALAT